MSYNNSINFNSIKIEGYRGRNFELKMNPVGENTVFIMDGNTGKTTTIELLRWCFSYPESKAKGKFKHMWTINAHVLDFAKLGKEQICTITIKFNGNGRSFSFKRITNGIYIRDRDKKIEQDTIINIHDILEIDHGNEVYEHDDVFDYLSENFKFNKCAEYFCFDGEKAREVMMSSSNRSNINLLLETINQRTTNPKLNEYEDKLLILKNKIYSQSKSKLTDISLKASINKIMGKNDELKRAESFLQETELHIQSISKGMEDLDKSIKNLDNEIIDKQSEILLEKTRLENSLENRTKTIENKRGLIFYESLKWIQFGTDNIINEIKKNVKETGKLPEPYRKDLIKECLKGSIPTCQICGRELDEKSIQRVKELEKLVATHEVHDFLSNELRISAGNFNAFDKNKEISNLIQEYTELVTQYDSIQLSESDKKLIEERNTLKTSNTKLIGEKAREEQSTEDIKETIKILKEEISELSAKNTSLNENRIIFDKIENTLNIIKESKLKTKEIAIKIISDVISEGVCSILGPNFSATLSEEEGLLLGENGFFNTEAGGMSGRLILSYCFAEAMTLTDPIIVDTPSGNIGSHREALAKHLKANHKQVILLCLPTEINDFAPYISSKDFVEIKNEER